MDFIFFMVNVELVPGKCFFHNKDPSLVYLAKQFFGTKGKVGRNSRLENSLVELLVEIEIIGNPFAFRDNVFYV